jgi:hypothetical protein
MSPTFIKGVKDYLPNAAITFDKFHVVKHLNDTIDELEAKNFGHLVMALSLTFQTLALT